MRYYEGLYAIHSRNAPDEPSIQLRHFISFLKMPNFMHVLRSNFHLSALSCFPLSSMHATAYFRRLLAIVIFFQNILIYPILR